MWSKKNGSVNLIWLSLLILCCSLFDLGEAQSEHIHAPSLGQKRIFDISASLIDDKPKPTKRVPEPKSSKFVEGFFDNLSWKELTNHQSEPTDSVSQSEPTKSAPHSEPTKSASQSEPTKSAPHSKPTKSASQSEPTKSAPYSKPSKSVPEPESNHDNYRNPTKTSKFADLADIVSSKVLFPIGRGPALVTRTLNDSKPIKSVSQSEPTKSAPYSKPSKSAPEPESNHDSYRNPTKTSTFADRLGDGVSSSILPGIVTRKVNDSKPIRSASHSKPTKGVPQSNSTSLLSTTDVHYDARDVTYFLESHPAHSVNDPRAYFTEERTTRSLAIMLHELERFPAKIRFAYVVRVFNELGRKIASKLNYYSAEVAAILRKTPDDLGNKPEVSMLVDVVDNAFESKEDVDPKEESDAMLTSEHPISGLIKSDKDKAAVFNASIVELSRKFTDILYFFTELATQKAIRIRSKPHRESMATLFGESLHLGAKTMIKELSKSDKFRVPSEIIFYCDKILNNTVSNFRERIKNGYSDTKSKVRSKLQAKDSQSFHDLNPMSDKTGMVGPWNNYLFTNLGSSERVVKLFASLLTRVPPEAKSRWVNMYISQFHTELERTLSGFVVMQGMPFNRNFSAAFLLDPARSVNINPNKVPIPRNNYEDDKNRIPARCYLAGRRWRLLLTRALRNYNAKDEVIKNLADKLAEYKIKLVKKSGNEIYRLCMPRLEVGVRGWGINGDPQANGDTSAKFPMTNPIEDLTSLPDPFISGARLGYKIGVKVGYNEERNATLELERSNRGKGNKVQQVRIETKYLAIASFRKATTVGAKKAFEIAIRNGYLTTLAVSIRAGIGIPAEAASRLTALKCTSFAGQAGMEAGRSVADIYLAEKRVAEDVRRAIIKVGEAHGLWAGEIMGKVIGSIVGKEAAEEAYKRGIIRGGKVARAKFHLEEYESGAKLGFEYGLMEGKRIASSSSLDPSAPRFFRFVEPIFSESDRTGEVEVDHWEKDLIPPMSNKAIENLQAKRNYTLVSGNLKGSYKVAKEIKNGLKRVSYSNVTYTLDVYAKGFIMNDVAYLTLNGTVNNFGALRGSLIAKDIFNDNKD